MDLFSPSSTDLRTAVLDPTREYRYRLDRTWSKGGARVMFLMLNPSTADHVVDDPTIRRCLQYAKDWGFGGLVVCNLFALRSTNPDALKPHADPIGFENDAYILRAACEVSLILCAWGKRGSLRNRARIVAESLRIQGHRLHCLKTNGDGSPVHPLYQPASLKPITFRGES